MKQGLKYVVVVAVAAAFVPLGVAGAASLVDSSDVKNNSLTGKDVKNKSLTKSDFRGSVKGPKGAKGATGATGPRGPAGAPGVRGTPGANGAPGGTVSAALNPADRRFSIVAGDNDAPFIRFGSVNRDGFILPAASLGIVGVVHVRDGVYRVEFDERIASLNPADINEVDSLAVSVRGTTPGIATVEPALSPDSAGEPNDVAIVRTFG